MMNKVGFIGLGDIGKPMAKCLLKAGFQLTVCGHIRKEPVEELRGLGADVVRFPKEVAQASDIVITMVRDDTQTEEVIWGHEGVMRGVKPDSAIIIMSTVSPLLCQRIASEAGKKGVGVLDAPVNGGTPAAEAGILTISVGGKRELLDVCRPVLEAIGSNLFHFGKVGMGQVAKLSNNIIASANIFAATEGLALGVRSGIDLEHLLEFVRVSSGNNWAVEHWNLISALKEVHKSGGTLDMQYKDMGLALNVAKEAHVELPLMAFTMQLDLGRLP